jgi:hypothetical protein
MKDRINKITNPEKLQKYSPEIDSALANKKKNGIVIGLQVCARLAQW